MLRDLFVAARTLAKRPAYALSVVLTLTLGIGASTMMFSLLDATLLRPLPFREPDRIVSLQGVYGPERDVRGASLPEVLDWRAMTRTLEQVSVFNVTSLNLRVGTEAIRVATEFVSADYFALVGVSPALGRAFLPEEDRTFDAAPVAMIGQKLWRERFGSNPNVLNTPIFLDDRQFTVVGVMPERFTGLSFVGEVWLPSMMLSMSSPDAYVNRGNRWLFAVARPKAGVTIEQAQADADRVAALLQQQYPDSNKDRGLQLVGLRQATLGSTVTLVGALFGAVMLFLLISCANVASLQLARTMGRRRELALRLALGAGRWRVIRHLLAESIVLAMVAGVAGALLAAWGLRAATLIAPQGALPSFLNAAVDVRALLFTIGASFACGALVTALPAMLHSRADLNESIKAGGGAIQPGLGSIRRPSVQHLLVVGEVALAMTLLAGAGLLAQSLSRQLHVSVGFNPAQVTAARVSLPPARYPLAARVAFVDRLQEKLSALPDVSAAAVGSDLPLRRNASASRLTTDMDPQNSLRFYRHRITPGFFRTLGITVLTGRPFGDQDRAGAPPVAIVNEAMARRVWGGADRAVGRTIKLGSASTATQIVGVVDDVRYRDLTTDITAAGAEPDVFVPFAQSSDWDLEVAVRSTSGAPVSLASLQRAVSEIDGGLPVYDVQIMTDELSRQTATVRFASALLGVFSAGALLLAALGAYGLIAYVVSLSGKDVAIRLALGADSRRVVLQILGNGLALILAGVLIGAVGARLAGAALRTQLFQTSPGDPLMLSGVAVTLMLVAAIAIYLPARRAARINPSAALRAE